MREPSDGDGRWEPTSRKPSSLVVEEAKLGWPAGTQRSDQNTRALMLLYVDCIVATFQQVIDS